MAQRFNVISLKKDFHNRHYNTEIMVDGRKGRYEIYTNAKFYFYDWLDNQISIWDGEDRAFNRELPYLCIKALDVKDKENESKLEKAILKFIKKECSKKT